MAQREWYLFNPLNVNPIVFMLKLVWFTCSFALLYFVACNLIDAAWLLPYPTTVLLPVFTAYYTIANENMRDEQRLYVQNLKQEQNNLVLAFVAQRAIAPTVNMHNMLEEIHTDRAALITTLYDRTQSNKYFGTFLNHTLSITKEEKAMLLEYKRKIYAAYSEGFLDKLSKSRSDFAGLSGGMHENFNDCLTLQDLANLRLVCKPVVPSEDWNRLHRRIKFSS